MRRTDDLIRRIETSLPADMYAQFARIAHKNERSIGSQLRVVVREALEKNEAPDAPNAEGSGTTAMQGRADGLAA